MTNIYEEELTHEQPGGHMAVHAATPAGKLGIFGWSIFDWALNPYFILVNIFVFAPYFSAEVIGDKVQGQASWGYIQAIAGASIALLSPFFGSLADAAGPRKPGILIFSLLACTGMASLWYVMPGMEYPILQTAIGVVIAATCLEFAFLFTPDQPRTGLSRMDAAKKGIAMVIGTLGKLPYYKNIATYLVARMVYYDGQSAVFIFTGVYAAGIFDWPTTQIGIYGLLIIMAQVPSSLLGGWLDDKFGSKATIIGAVSLFALGLLMLVGTTETAAAFFIPVSMEPLEPLSFIGSALNAAGFETSAERAFLALGVLTGLFAGPSISSSRTMLARIAPPSMMAEFFGLYALCGKATSFMAPLTVAIVTSAMNSQRIGLASVLVFMVVGLGLMVFVREEQSTAHTEH